MARVTVEDCVTIVPNRFDLVIYAAQRARDVAAGAALTVDRDNDKNPVVALREIAEKTITPEALEDAVVRGMQKYVDLDEPEEEGLEMLAADAIAEAVAEDLGHVVEDGGEIAEDTGESPVAESDGEVADDQG